MTTEISPSRDIETCLALRHQVFVVEQNVPIDLERDGLDDVAHHVLAVVDGVPMGTARMLIDGQTAKIGRVCVLEAARGTGLGAGLIEACLAHLRTLPGVTRAKLGAQTHALGFYERFGFSAFGPVYDDAGIPHRDMERTL